MAPSVPYQSLLFRLLHGAIALLSVAAIVTGFWVYNMFDQRWGSLPLPEVIDIQGIHGTIALTAFLLFPLFAFYSFHLGDRRLVQDQTLGEIGQLPKPGGWVALHRLANTFMLLGLTFAVVSGRMMKEEWLPKGELDHLAYYAHLLGWGVMVLALAFHVLLGVKVGGVPLIVSMAQWGWRKTDNPQAWLKAIRISNSTTLKVVEVVVFGGIILAWIIPLFGESS